MSKTYTGLDVVDRDHYFVVDPFTREISSKNPQKSTLIRNDHNSERFTFEVPRFIEDRDLTMCNTVRVHYRNGKNTGVYTITDVEPYPFVNDTLICSWLISQNATSSAGTLSFMLKFSQVDDEGNVEYAWSTRAYDGVDVISDIEAPDVFESDYFDLIEQMKSQVMAELTDYIDTILANKT